MIPILDCTTLVSGPHTTDANGSISVDGITPGTYYVKEIGHTDSSVNEKYVCSGTNPQKVTIAGGAAASVTFINKIKTGNFSLTKTTSDGLNLAGWEFGIYSDSGCTTLVSGPHTTDSKGAISVTGLEIGTYYVKELGHRDDDIEAMYSCASDNPQKVTITYGTTASVSFHNSLEPGSVKLIKQTNTGENLSGWQIGIYTDVACTKPIEGSPFTTGTDGTILIDGLTPQKLYAKEIAVDDPYWVCDSSVKAITVKANSTVSVTFSNTHNGDLRVKKNAIDGSPEGWNFQILDANRELVETITTGEDGYAASGKLEPGTYYVVEIHDRDETYPSESQLDQDTPSDSPEPTEPDTYTDLWRDMVDYNKEIYINGQKGLDCKLAYEDPSFVLADYGLESEVFAVISIPALELEMPVFLGANYRHMADGAALLGQTSIPIGGKNTNCIIAGHRGWGGASYFRYVDKLQPGDEVIITNLWETLQYRVAEIQIIQPNEVEQILIKPGQELVTLLTCHPYASGGRQRYLVICERVNENN